MSGEDIPRDTEKSTIDELFRRSKDLKSSAKYAEAISFVSKIRTYKPFNNMLVYIQNPETTFYATVNRWKNDFGRRVREDARPMIILAPMHPVLLVYDVLDTEGDDLPEWFEEAFDVEGYFDDNTLDRTVENCLFHYAIRVEEKEMGLLHGGTATRFDTGGHFKMKIELKHRVDIKAQYEVLCHELAHIFLGHLGSDKNRWWPSRMNLTRNQKEIEAESVAYIVCRRLGLVTRSAEYLTGYIKDENDLSRISVDLITKVAGKIEDMHKKKLSERILRSV